MNIFWFNVVDMLLEPCQLDHFWFNVVDILLATSPLFVFKSAIGFEEKIASLPGLLGRVWFQSPIGRSAVPNSENRGFIRLHFVFGCWNETERLHLHW
jgi:hypothetical protein